LSHPAKVIFPNAKTQILPQASSTSILMKHPDQTIFISNVTAIVFLWKCIEELKIDKGRIGREE
jgi:hypothetical protein